MRGQPFTNGYAAAGADGGRAASPALGCRRPGQSLATIYRQQDVLCPLGNQSETARGLVAIEVFFAPPLPVWMASTRPKADLSST